MRLEAYGTTVDIGWDDDTDHIPRRITETQDFYERTLLEDAYDRAPQGLVIDAGAHIGNHTLWFAAVMGRQVMAFEPEPHTYDVLVANIDRNRLWDRVQARCVALGPANGWGSIRSRNQANTGSTRIAFDDAGHVTVRALDDYHLDVAVLKVDVEGQAMAVLHGAMATIERCRPLVYVETDDDGRIAELFDELRYHHLGWMGATPTHVYQAA